MNKYLYVTFESLYDALQCEKVCKKNKLKGRLVTVPRELSAGCGYAWRTLTNNEEKMLALIQEHQIAFSQIEIL